MPTKTVDTLQYKPKSRVPTFDQCKWRALTGVTFCYLFYYTGRQTLGFAIPGIQHDYSLSKYEIEIGWVSATLLWCYATDQFINSNLGDKFGGKRMMIAGAILSLGANWILSYGHSFWFFLLAWGRTVTFSPWFLRLAVACCRTGGVINIAALCKTYMSDFPGVPGRYATGLEQHYH